MRNTDKYDDPFYGPNEFNRDRFGPGRTYNRSDRDLGDRASNEVRSWFGDDEAERRRRLDEQRNRQLSYDNRHVRPDYHTGTHSGFGQHQRSDSGRAHYAVPGLEPGDPNFGRRIHGHPYPSSYQRHYYNAPEHQLHERDLLDQAGDEIRSWFGDREAARRRRQDEQENLYPPYNTYRDRERNRDWDRDPDFDRDRGLRSHRW